jgi:hypothetical protein
MTVTKKEKKFLSLTFAHVLGSVASHVGLVLHTYASRALGIQQVEITTLATWLNMSYSTSQCMIPLPCQPTHCMGSCCPQEG